MGGSLPTHAMPQKKKVSATKLLGYGGLNKTNEEIARINFDYMMNCDEDKSPGAGYHGEGVSGNNNKGQDDRAHLGTL